jgi:hypothetical protein
MPSIDLSLPEEVHEVAFDAYRAWSEGNRTLSPKSVEALGAQLLALSGNLQELWYAVASLGALALTFEAEGDAKAAATIRDLVARQAAHFRPILEELEGEASEEQKASAAAFSQMFGGEGAKMSAPKHDEAAPEGSVSLKSLLPNPALGRSPSGGPGRPAPSKPAETPSPPKARARRGRPIGVDGPSVPASAPERPGPSEAPPPDASSLQTNAPPAPEGGADAPEPSRGAPRAPAAGPRAPARGRAGPRPGPRAAPRRPAARPSGRPAPRGRPGRPQPSGPRGSGKR